MKARVALASVVAVVLVSVQPSVLLFVAAGAAVGVLAAVLLAQAAVARALGAAGRARASAVGRGLVLVIAIGIVAVLSIQLGSDPRFIGPGGVAQVRGVGYAAEFEYDESAGGWVADERIRIGRSELTALANPESRGRVTRPPLRGRALGPEWRFAGLRGARGQVLVFTRARTVPVDVPRWPPVRERGIRIGSISSPVLGTLLVPADGSPVELRAPRNLVRETDPDGERRGFGDEDIVALRLKGLEDDVDRRTVRVRVANAIGRSSFYGALDDVTGWGVFTLLFGGIPAVVVGFLLTRWLKRRFPERSPAPPAA